MRWRTLALIALHSNPPEAGCVLKDIKGREVLVKPDNGKLKSGKIKKEKP